MSSSDPTSDPVVKYGFTAVPSSVTVLLETTPAPESILSPPFIPVSDTPVPNTILAQRIQAYARKNLPEPVYNHSLRVYHYGLAIKRYRFPSWCFTDETYFLCCVLHDIGTPEEKMRKTLLSFEFHGALLALNVLQNVAAVDDSWNDIVRAASILAPGTPTPTTANAPDVGIAPKEQVESVVEAIVRHQDLCETGKITAVGQLLQIATIYDNTGSYIDLVHPATIEDVSKHFPRLRWTNCFVDTIRRENGMKPWAHTSVLGEEDFPAKVLANKLMEPYE